MPRDLSISHYRNFGIIAHVDAGKTTLTERVLFFTGRIRKTGEVHDGNTAMDFDPIERKRGITIQSAATTVYWERREGARPGKYRMNLIDTPGHIDFAVEVERSLRVLDGAVVVLDAANGVEPQTEAVWRQTDSHRVPRVVFVNKMDRVGADFSASVASLRERLGAKAIAVQLPLGEGAEHRGVVDLLRRKAVVFESSGMQYQPVPAALVDAVEAARMAIVELCADFDDEVLRCFVEGRGAEVGEEALARALRKGTLALALTPVVCGAAYQNSGVQPLLDAVVDYLPAPEDLPPVTGEDPRTGTPQLRRHSDAEPLSARVFKVVSDPHLGSLAFVRVYSGVLRTGDKVHSSVTGRTERVGRLLLVHAQERETVPEAQAGVIAAAVGLREVRTGQTLSDPEAPVVLESLHFPEPVVELALQPKTRLDADRLGAALRRLELEDPTLKVSVDEETGQAILRGMGELHLEVVLEKLRTEQNVDVSSGMPRVSYRETLRGSARVDYVHSKQTGGPGQYARVVLEVRPLERGEGFRFADETRGGVVPREWVPAVERGVMGAMERGVLDGNPMVDVEVKLVDGGTHPKDSSAVAFELAGSHAFQEAARIAGVVVLEPVLTAEISVPEPFVGNVIADLGSRRGKVLALTAAGNLHRVQATAPLRQMFGYVGSLRSRTEGRGTVSMRLSHYQEV